VICDDNGRDSFDADEDRTELRETARRYPRWCPVWSRTVEPAEPHFAGERDP
jgi:hypothetical protein